MVLPTGLQGDQRLTVVEKDANGRVSFARLCRWREAAPIRAQPAHALGRAGELDRGRRWLSSGGRTGAGRRARRHPCWSYGRLLAARKLGLAEVPVTGHRGLVELHKVRAAGHSRGPRRSRYCWPTSPSPPSPGFHPRHSNNSVRARNSSCKLRTSGFP